jgi:hypothetical protein
MSSAVRHHRIAVWSQLDVAVTVYGVIALSFMMVMYALERRGRGFILAFAAGCVASSIYGFLAGAWPFGVVELIWSAIALRRWSIQAQSGGPFDHPTPCG